MEIVYILKIRASSMTLLAKSIHTFVDIVFIQFAWNNDTGPRFSALPLYKGTELSLDILIPKEALAYTV